MLFKSRESLITRLMGILSDPGYRYSVVGFFISILFSVWVIFSNDTLNSDSIKYIDDARHIKNNFFGVIVAGDFFKSYSLLISLIGSALNIPMQYAAHAINTIFIAFSVSILTRISFIMSNNSIVALSAMILILINPHINEYRAYIIRDPGFWMFFLLGILYLAKYGHNYRLKYAISWGAATVFSILFRVEGVMILILAPLIFFIYPWVSIRKNIKHSLLLYTTPFICLLILVGIYVTSGMSFSLSGLHHLYSGNGSSGFIVELSKRSELLNEQIFNGMSSNQAIYSLIAALTAIVAVKVFFVATPLYTALAILGLYVTYRDKLVKNYLAVFIYAAISLAILTGFVFKQYFLQGRYAVPLTFCIIILASYSLPLIYQKSSFIWAGKSSRFNKAITIMVSTWLVFLLIDGLVSFGHRKDYIRHAGKWIEENIPAHERLWNNNPALNYYAGRLSTTPDAQYRSVLSEDVENSRVPDVHGGVLALRMKDEQTSLHSRILENRRFSLLKEFSNTRGDKVYIYRAN